MTAKKNDPEFAEWVASLPEAEASAWSPPAAEWDLGRELQAAIFDRLGDLIAATVNVSGAARSAMKPPARYPRPVTEIEKAKARAESRIEAELDGLIAAAHATWATEHGGEVPS